VPPFQRVCALNAVVGLQTGNGAIVGQETPDGEQTSRETAPSRFTGMTIWSSPTIPLGSISFPRPSFSGGISNLYPSMSRQLSEAAPELQRLAP